MQGMSEIFVSHSNGFCFLKVARKREGTASVLFPGLAQHRLWPHTASRYSTTQIPVHCVQVKHIVSESQLHRLVASKDVQVDTTVGGGVLLSCKRGTIIILLVR